MHVKRETSTTTSDLHLQSVSESIKRLAISRDGHPTMALTIANPENCPPPPPARGNVLTVMSSARDDFSSRYEILREVGKGGFSVVYQCRRRDTGQEFAVKVVDLRPLRLRERFNPARLKREVDIMRRLDHPNIVKFIEVYEDADHLMMVMEYCPGRELFDVILARKFFSEEDAKPVFAQVAQALYYLHSLSILHRDVKPENILIVNSLDPVTRLPIVKLLDFGLSKNAGAGSVAKTFVGTPCYLAPEVEMTSKGLGGTYGLEADCWSLGAVLYVMLVARFPEFEQEPHTGKVVVKLPAILWNNISPEAKDLIRSLMNTNPAARLTMEGVLRHPWLGAYRMNDQQISAIAVRTSDLNHRLQEEEDIIEAEEEMQHGHEEQPQEISASGQVIHHSTMVVRHHEKSRANAELKLTPLLNLQMSVATCFQEAHKQYDSYPEVASQIRKGAVLCRSQFDESTKMLHKVQQTASEVLSMFPDLELAVEEDEPELATHFFEVVKSWVTQLREQVEATQKINKASISQIQKVVEQTSIGLKEEQRQRNIQQTNALMSDLMSKLAIGGHNDFDKQHNYSLTTANSRLDANQVLDLFCAMFNLSHNATGHANAASGGSRRHKSSSGSPIVVGNGNLAGFSTPNGREKQKESHFPVLDTAVEVVDASPCVSPFPATHSNPSRSMMEDVEDDDDDSDDNRYEYSVQSPPEQLPPHKLHNFQTQQYRKHNSLDKREMSSLSSSLSSHQLTDPLPGSSASATKNSNSNLPVNAQSTSMSAITFEPNQLVPQPPVNSQRDNHPSPKGSPNRLTEVLHKLGEVDSILEELNTFWGNTEVVLELLTKKGQRVEQFIGFASKPKLMARFRERMEEYKRFWEGVQMMCSNYLAGLDNGAHSGHRMYGFLERTGDSFNTNSTGKGDSFDSTGNS